MDPGTLFTDIGHFKKVGIKARRPNGISISIFMHPRGTGSHYDPIDAKTFNVIFNEILTGVRTHILIIPGHGDMGKGLGERRQLFNVDRCRNINSTMTDVYTNLHNLPNQDNGIME